MITAYHRPETAEQALALLGRKQIKTIALVGYDAILPPDADEVVDLQGLPFNHITSEANGFTIGAGVRLQVLVEHPALPAWLRGVIQAEAPNTFRNMHTLASSIHAAHSDSMLLAALLVCETQLSFLTEHGAHVCALHEYLKRPLLGVLTAVDLQIDGRGAEARVGRTPADVPIVAAVGRRGDDGEVRLAVSGVAATPLLVDANALEQLSPYEDFRGSSAYRQEMAQVLCQRVMNALA